MQSAPQFPIKVFFHEDNDEWELDSRDDIECNLEWFDSEDPDENASVTDNLGRAVCLKVKELKIVILKLAGTDLT